MGGCWCWLHSFHSSTASERPIRKPKLGPAISARCLAWELAFAFRERTNEEENSCAYASACACSCCGVELLRPIASRVSLPLVERVVVGSACCGLRVAWQNVVAVVSRVAVLYCPLITFPSQRLFFLSDAHGVQRRNVSVVCPQLNDRTIQSLLCLCHCFAFLFRLAFVIWYLSVFYWKKGRHVLIFLSLGMSSGGILL